MVRGCKRLKTAAIIAVGLMSASAQANPFIVETAQPDQQFQSVFGLRYWYGSGSTSKVLYGLTRDTLNSRLTYDGLHSHSLEFYTRVDHSSGLFWKAYGGGGFLTGGNLRDEDFPPALTPYSSTNSTLQNQQLGYVSTDIGGALLRGTDFRFDGFVGYHYFHQRVKAFGCQQTASNFAICGVPIPDTVAGIVEDDSWNALRLGLAAEIPLGDKIRLNVEGAWLPYVYMQGGDNHLLRSDLPHPVPEDGHGWGYQFEASLSYRYSDAISFGGGFRYWYMQAAGGSDFTAIGGTVQPLDFKATNYGVFLQGAYHFGPF